MNEFDPEWMQKLKTTDPLRAKTFTPEKMSVIEKAVENMNKPSRGRKRKVWIPGFAAVVAAVIFVSGILPSGPYTGWLSDLFENEQNDGTTAKPNPIPPDQADPQPEIEPQPPAETVPLTGKLKDQLQFSTESEMTISIHDAQSGKDIEIPADREYVILQSLNGTDLTAAKAQEAASSGPEASVFLRFLVDGKIYQIPYRLKANTIEWKGQSFYVDDGIMLLMHGLLLPETKLTQIDRVFEQARKEQENGQVIEQENRYDWERLQINGKDYAAWEKELKNQPLVSEKKYYNFFTEKMNSIRQYEGITALNQAILFEDPKYGTKDGIRVGLTEAEVIAKLGEPNKKSTTEWSYKDGDYSQFHLYFENGKVLYIVIAMPL
ncbi:hypothetical protein [Paenibacillus harenae]|uniref:DUF4367 domain-containing protein n=1 Tax=Paenibacillus harenae TaxID=306543 RepID=A0ABT9U682_PAEHA|nr:hypothetical protein [Paenibacillus harenae]MDQ0115146.1 hypothetical protein [Paenibacillus harenae]